VEARRSWSGEGSPTSDTRIGRKGPAICPGLRSESAGPHDDRGAARRSRAAGGGEKHIRGNGGKQYSITKEGAADDFAAHNLRQQEALLGAGKCRLCSVLSVIPGLRQSWSGPRLGHLSPWKALGCSRGLFASPPDFERQDLPDVAQVDTFREAGNGLSLHPQGGKVTVR